MATDNDSPLTTQASGRTAIIALTRNGARMARTLAGLLEGDVALLLDRRFHEEDDTAEIFDLPLRPVVERAFTEYSNLVLFLSAGSRAMRRGPSAGRGTGC